ncbi:MAG: hypothetical protein AVDCRST_MAG01-01-2333 [uncultured Rubrobacteraceae bacterium]|uniref:Uncharacterized protein n=1 Tax=uncultured Rubrobacteraceae bacterium TaxID=349277 RepID=A0A6J4PWU3_9ACTN|nr:MAG: hypothetical protein AVDCRST_MAG01-01-2333 [uncultured Rubrobacteraceae bacterium]
MNDRRAAPPKTLRRTSENPPRKNAPRPLRFSLRTPSENAAGGGPESRFGGGKRRDREHRVSARAGFGFREVSVEDFFGDFGVMLGCRRGLSGGGLGWRVVGLEGEVLGGVGERRWSLGFEDAMGGGGGFGMGGRLVRGGGFVMYGCGMMGRSLSGSGRIFGTVAEGVGCASGARDRTGVVDRCFTGGRGRREERCYGGGRGPGAWGQLRYRPSSPASGFAFGSAYGRTRRTTGGPSEARVVAGAQRTRHRPLAESVPRPRSIVESIGAGSVGSVGGAGGR